MRLKNMIILYFQLCSSSRHKGMIPKMIIYFIAGLYAYHDIKERNHPQGSSHFGTHNFYPIEPYCYHKCRSAKDVFNDYPNRSIWFPCQYFQACTFVNALHQKTTTALRYNQKIFLDYGLVRFRFVNSLLYKKTINQSSTNTTRRGWTGKGKDINLPIDFKEPDECVSFPKGPINLHLWRLYITPSLTQRAVVIH